jgi:signal transduction histidine kinase
MSSTIDDFRNFFKPDREKMPFSLKVAVRDALSVVEASFMSNGITVTLDVKQDVSVMGFPNEYAQVVMNILGNSKDAILTHNVQHGRVEIAIGQEADQAYVSISDNGGGIAGDVMEKIFDPYFTTREKGTGIGLYMSKMIIENNMNGRIAVRNTHDGAEFRVVTPLSGNGGGNG